MEEGETKNAGGEGRHISPLIDAEGVFGAGGLESGCGKVVGQVLLVNEEAVGQNLGLIHDVD